LRFDRIDLGLFAGALAVRVVALLEVRAGPLLRYLFIDSRFYDEFGRRLAGGEGLPDGPFFMNVLYGFFLAAAHALAPGDEAGRLLALGVQCGMGAATGLFVRRIAREVGHEREGIAAAVGLAIYGPSIFYDVSLLTPSLLAFLTTLGTWLALRAFEPPRSGRAFVLGAVGGLLVLGRANHLLLVAAWAAIAAVRHRATSARPILAMLLGVALLVTPITLRNFRQTGEWILVTANGGMALWAGNSEVSTGIYTQLPFLSNPVPEQEAEEFRMEASRRAGQPLTLAESSGYWTGETIRRWLESPADMLRLSARKLRFWFHATESQTNLSYYFARDQSVTLSILRIHFGWILPLAVLGLAVEGRRRPWLLAPIVVSLVTCLAFYVSSEYRQTVVPLMILFAAFGGRWVLGWLRPGASTVRRVVAVAGLLLLTVAFNVRDPFLARLQSRRVDYLNFGTLAADAGDLDVAERFLRRSIAIDPAWPPSRDRLAEVLQRQGRVAEAAEQRLAPETSSDAVDPGFAQAFARFQAGEFAEAERMFRELASRPGSLRAAALNNAGLCAMRTGRPASAESLFTAAQGADPAYVSPVIHRGRLSLAAGDSAAAAAYAREALGMAPDDDRARRLLEHSGAR
jgi:hypothetical protein